MNSKSGNNFMSMPWSKKKLFWVDRIKPSPEFLQECKLLFFVWLRLLPTSVIRNRSSGSDVNDERVKSPHAKSGSVKGRIAALENPKARKVTKVPFSNRPIDIIYNKISPVVVALVSSSSHLLQSSSDGSDDDDFGTKTQSYIVKGIAFCRKFLDVMVWTKMISENTQNRIVSTLLECSNLLPAAVTLLMPSYFTSFGVVYVQLIVPCATSANSHDALKRAKTNMDMVRLTNTGVRYLQYWVVQGILSLILSSFAPVLAWIPLSTHLVWLFWAYTQLEGTTVRLYDILEWDLIAFGILTSHPNKSGKENMDVNNSSMMKLFNTVISRIPSDSRHSIHGSVASDEDDKQIAGERKIMIEAQEGAEYIVEANPRISPKSAEDGETHAKTEAGATRQLKTKPVDDNEREQEQTCKDSVEEPTTNKKEANNIEGEDKHNTAGQIQDKSPSDGNYSAEGKKEAVTENKSEDSDDYVRVEDD
eukprot:CAMPEP_0197237044 /NCGR_PEP_ID=MMETSP1429-20130617/3986_1 /TAXON_ID=49237 /ORGANISM="Chaetoceros  sp., Strain UNC1202" /LENGTH=475 /DNA_ID=CAMNT_0042695965 /DNA_START=49 /DNA_END=1476 /DNA_ORIENTATION=-